MSLSFIKKAFLLKETSHFIKKPILTKQIGLNKVGLTLIKKPLLIKDASHTTARLLLIKENALSSRSLLIEEAVLSKVRLHG